MTAARLLAVDQAVELGFDDGVTGASSLFQARPSQSCCPGMLHDGAEGVRAVKRYGGRVIAQDPATACAPGMPAAAIATGCTDFVLSPERIPYALITLAMAPGGAELFSVPLPHWAKIGA